MTHKINIWLLLLLLSGLSACSSTPPLPVPQDNPPLTVVRDNVAAYQGKPIAWGGVILETTVREHETRIAMLAKPLANNAEPLEVDASLGRFTAVFTGFRDPAIFAAGRKLTVSGKITGSERRKVGEYEYEYVTVQAEAAHLWPQPQPRSYYDDYWYDPWYPYPWYYPYYPHYHHRRSIESIK